MEMSVNMSTEIPHVYDWDWDVNNYQSRYPPDYWNLCQLFMVLNKTKYPEIRLVQLTDAFFNKGLYRMDCDPKTDRIVAALSIPVVEHLLSSHPGYIHHPFSNQDYENRSEATDEVKTGEENILNCNLKLSCSQYRKLVKERKLAEGTWKSKSEWRKSKDLASRKKKNKSKSVKVESAQSETPKIAGGIVLDSALSKKVTPRVKRTRWDQTTPTASTARVGKRVDAGENKPTFKKLFGRKMAAVPEAFPQVRFTEEQAEALEEQLVSELCLVEEGTKLQIQKTYLESGALILTCSNEDTVDWLKTISHKLRVGGDEEVVVKVGNYKDLLKTTRVLLRTNNRLAKREAKDLIRMIKTQNSGLSVDDWRIVSCKREEECQTLVLAVDEASVQTLKATGWRLFLGLEQVQLKVLTGDAKKESLRLISTARLPSLTPVADSERRRWT
ncbi:uncharacterized protein LOC128996035 [Macrosteles quadrilineatus]|uniref:uncharacterized protein LOC128996035 n=1 Tax=Macrosteles quadrilineatus TaxID=74068 RepID=UPI0023E171DF|nr:uncharacterized protein LOC128996035 [Macrosteles quadrilineatus]